MFERLIRSPTEDRWSVNSKVELRTLLARSAGRGESSNRTPSLRRLGQEKVIQCQLRTSPTSLAASPVSIDVTRRSSSNARSVCSVRCTSQRYGRNTLEPAPTFPLWTGPNGGVAPRRIARPARKPASSRLRFPKLALAKMLEGFVLLDRW